VGLSGVLVNLVFLALFADLLRIQTNLASALAIEISIVTNFFLNELWTFRDRISDDRSMLGRGLRFHLVSIAGGAVQWTVFVAANVLWLFVMGGGAAVDGYFGGAGGGWIDTYIARPVAQPPEVGSLKYLSQLFGIAVATFWNFFANFYWTWKERA
jgi:putative flippase GtrA